MTLLPGPVALFSGGTFAGQGLLGRLHDDETTFVPYAIDPSTSVEVTHEDATEPSRLVSVTRAVVTLEDTSVHRTRFRVEPGAQACYEAILRNFAARAWRRPLTAEEDAGLVELFATVKAGGEIEADAMRLVMRAVMLSPKFLYRARTASSKLG